MFFGKSAATSKLNTCVIDRAFFFQSIRPLFGAMSQTQVDGCNSLLTAWEKDFASNPVCFLAYLLATAFHETARTMRPIEEIGHGKGKAYGPTGFWGRVYVQLTWQANYLKAGQKLGVDLVGNPSLALEPPIAARILFQGSIEGWFTGKTCADYLPASPIQARRIINGMDRAEIIEGYYTAFLAALRPVSAASPHAPASTPAVGWFAKITSIFNRKG
jgi:hypothetical protein